MLTRLILSGVATYVPFLGRFRGGGTGGTDSARYCYSVWLRHLVMAYRNGLCRGVPSVVAELGPGDSLGVGIAALLSGAKRYHALEVVKYASAALNLQVLDQLVELFKKKEPIPDEDEFPLVKPKLESYNFPNAILDDLSLESCLAVKRVEEIRRSIASSDESGSLVRYVVPWSDDGVIDAGTIDMIYSQAVLEHVEDLQGAYRAMRTWLKPDGFISHTVDFKSHGTAKRWNGHWTYSDFTWALIKGRRKYLLNRQPLSTHLRLMSDAGFRSRYMKTTETPSEIRPRDLAKRLRGVSEGDLITSGAFFQADKVPGSDAALPPR